MDGIGRWGWKIRMVGIKEIAEHKLVCGRLAQLAGLFDEMADAYDERAGQYGFHCEGCVDNCCLTRFYHHTVLELLYLHQGLGALSATCREAVLARCRQVIRISREKQGSPDSLRVLCPINEGGRCILYHHRPMICRLHGIPHELHMPAGGVQHHPGCDTFIRRMQGSIKYHSFDRTPYYRRMAQLEQELRRTLGFRQRLKLTVAQILQADTLLEEIATALDRIS